MDKRLYMKLKGIQNSYFKKDMLTIFLKKEIFLNKIFKNIDLLGVKNEDPHKLKSLIDSLSSLDKIYLDENAKDIYYQKRSLGCTFCTLGKGCTVVLSYKCHRDCFFCYEETPLDPKVIIDPYDKHDMDKIYAIVDESFSNPNNKTLAITGGEPFLFIDKVYEVLEYVNKAYPGKNTRIYTTGDIMNEQILQRLQELELDEIRFSIKPYEQPNLTVYAMAKKYIPSILIEMPVQPGSKEYMIDILSQIDDQGSVDGINLNELTFNNLNPHKFIEAGYQLDLPGGNDRIYQRYYDIPKIEIGVSGSKGLCLELIEYFAKKKAGFYMHYCDLDTVSIHHYIYKKQHAESLKNPYSQITDLGLHKLLRVYSHLQSILQVLSNNGITEFYNSGNYIELSVDHLPLLKDRGYILVIIYKNCDYRYDVDFEIINM